MHRFLLDITHGNSFVKRQAFSPPTASKTAVLYNGVFLLTLSTGAIFIYSIGPNRPVWNRWRPRVKDNGVILADRLYKIIYGTATAKLSLAVPHFEFRWTFSDVLYFAPIKKVIEFERVTQVCFSRNKVIKSNHLKQKFSFEPFVASNKNSVLQLYFLYFLLSARFTKFTIGSLRCIITDSLRRYALVDSLLFARGRHRS